MRITGKLSAFCYVLIVASSVTLCRATEQGNSLTFHERSWEVKHPTDSNTIIRIVSARTEGFADDGTFIRRGLYVSRDGCLTWTNVNNRFDFTGAFYIHPLTGKWFAGVFDTWLTTNREGFVEMAGGYKILMSEDGLRWQDITRGNGHVQRVSWFNQDPDKPKRVCVYVSPEVALGRGVYILQSVDDMYSSWTRHDVRDGEEGIELMRRFAPKRSGQSAGGAKPARSPESGKGIILSDVSDTNSPAIKEGGSTNGPAVLPHQKTIQ